MLSSNDESDNNDDHDGIISFKILVTLLNVSNYYYYYKFIRNRDKLTSPLMQRHWKYLVTEDRRREDCSSTPSLPLPFSPNQIEALMQIAGFLVNFLLGQVIRAALRPDDTVI